MQSIKNYLIGSMVFTIIVLFLALTNTGVTRAIADEFKDVRIVNTASQPALVRDVDNTTRMPVHFNESYTVPAGKRLVIEYVSLDIAGSAECDLVTAALSAEGAVLHLFNPTFVGMITIGPSTAYKYGLSQEARAYVGQNRTVTLGLQTYTGCFADVRHAGVTGYLVDLQ